MLLLPDNLNSLELKRDEKIFVNSIKNNLYGWDICLININPTGKKDNEMIALIGDRGLILIKIYDLEKEQAFVFLQDAVFKPNYDSSVEILKMKLLSHKVLCSNDNTLNFPVNYLLYFPQMERSKLVGISPESNFIANKCLFKEDKDDISINADKMFNNLLNDSLIPCNMNNKLNDKEKDIVVQRIAPEYTIPRVGVISEEIKITGKSELDYQISNTDKIIEVLRLDQEQVNIVNNMRRGEQLILACAGSGKSVLLISKSFKMASIHEDKRFLITCYNVNLRNYYEWQIEVAGFKEKNVECISFIALCRKLLNKYDIRYNSLDYDEIFTKANRALDEGKIKDRYFGIFIDEVQVFKPEWYKFCYKLLENKNSDSHIFVICGDISQNINNNIKRGVAPWQGDPELPKFRGGNRSLRIEKNYRNTIQINDFVNFFINYSNEYFDKFNIKIENRDEMFLRGKAFRQGNLPIISSIREDSNVAEAQAIIGAIEKLHKERSIPYTDIAVVMYNTKYSGVRNWKSGKYDPLNCLIKLLNEKSINYSLFMDVNGNTREHYATRDGITLITCQGALGLDFKAIILCGLKPMGEYYKSKNEKMLNTNDENLADRKEEFYKNINTLYTACTRAKDELIIIVSEQPNDSIYSKLMIKAIISLTSRKNYYDSLIRGSVVNDKI